MMLWEKPDDRDGGEADDDPNDDDDLEVEDDDPEEEEFATEFEANLAKEHPELLDAYREATSGLHSALQKERDKAKGKAQVEKELKTYKEKEAEAAREQRTKEENLEADLATANARAEKAETKLQTLQKKSVVQTAAMKLNFRDPTDAVSFVDMGSLEIGEDEAENEKAALALLKPVAKDKPYLLKKDLGDGNEHNNDPKKLDKDPAKKAEIKKKQPKINI